MCKLNDTKAEGLRGSSLLLLEEVFELDKDNLEIGNCN